MLLPQLLLQLQSGSLLQALLVSHAKAWGDTAACQG